MIKLKLNPKTIGVAHTHVFFTDIMERKEEAYL